MAGTLLIDGNDLQDHALIHDISGLVGNAPNRGDVIRMDWTDGAVWDPGPNDAYDFDVPVTMKGLSEADALEDLAWLQSWQGVEVTLTRRLTRGSTQTDETCQAVLVDAIQISYDFDARNLMTAFLVFTNLSGVWTVVP
jgi:hypothetical protein